MARAAVGIRHAGSGDVAKIVGLSGGLFREDAGRRDSFVDQDWPAREGGHHFARLLEGEGSLCLLAESDGETVGYLAGYVDGGDTLRPVAVAELESMYVMEDYRCRGLGTRMVEEFFAWASSRGAKRASVTAYAANDRALRFYGRNGFGPRSVSLERGLG